MRIIGRLNIGGPAIHVALLTQKLPADVYETTLVTGSVDQGEGDMSYYAEARQVQPIIVPAMHRAVRPLEDLRALSAIRQLIRQHQPHVVHTHTAKAGFIGRLAARLEGVPVVVHTFHGHVFKGYFSPAKSKAFVWLERLAANWADTIITLTESLRRELANEYHITRRGHITVLPLGLDLTPFATTERKNGIFRSEWNIPPDVPLIGIVGRLTAIKNHRLFLQAAAQILAQQPNAHFAIIGDGEDRALLQDYARQLGIDPHVTFTGWERDTAKVFADLDVKVISSENEGTPVTLIEALVSGCPVVSTDVGGVREMLEGGAFGRLVPFGDAQALATATLETLHNPPDPEPARTAMLKRYSIDRLVSDIDGLYQGLLTKKRANPRTPQ